MVQPACHKVERWKTTLCRFHIVKRNQTEHKILAYGVDNITDCMEKVSEQALSKMFPGLDPARVTRPMGAVDVLIGLDYASYHPVPSKEYKIPGAEENHLRVLEGQFGTGLLLEGQHDPMQEPTSILILCENI